VSPSSASPSSGSQDPGQEPGRPVHPIEAESYRILHRRVDLASWPPGPAAVAARVVHATADPSLVASLVVDERAVAAGVEALRGQAPVICDVEMVRSAVSVPGARCLLAAVADAGGHPSRSAAAMARAASEHPSGAVVVVGCAPTALAEVNRRLADGSLRPALVVGVPVGFVGAASSKEELLQVAAAAGVPVIALRGERGGAAVAAAIVNALARLAGSPSRGDQRPPMLAIGHGSRAAAGATELRRFVAKLVAARPGVPVASGAIEFVEPGLDDALDEAAGLAAASDVPAVVAVPLVLLAAGHLKDDGPAALARARRRHPGIRFTYGRDLGVHPAVLEVVGERVAAASASLPGGTPDAVVVVGRGSTDPDANADLAKAARLLADGRHLARPLPDLPGGELQEGNERTGLPRGDQAGAELPEGPPPLALVEPAFVSLARPSVAGALDRCHRLGARRIVVVPYFLFTGVLVDRIAEQAAAWAAANPAAAVVTAPHMGPDDRLVQLVWNRYDEALTGPVHMNCDGCLHRSPLPGYEHRVGAPPGV